MKKILLVAFMATATLAANAQLSNLISKLKGTSSTTTETTTTTTTSTATAATTTAAADATTAGQNAGVALNALMQQYKADGKFNASNLTNITNAFSLIQNSAALKDNTKNKTYIKEFTSGLIKGAAGLVTTSNASSVISSLTQLASSAASSTAASTASSTASSALSSVTSAASSASTAASTVASSASSISSLLSSLMGK